MKTREYKYTDLWNDLPDEERHRLNFHAIEQQILHIEQAKSVLIRNHKKALKEFNDQIKNLEQFLKQLERQKHKSYIQNILILRKLDRDGYGFKKSEKTYSKEEKEGILSVDITASYTEGDLAKLNGEIYEFQIRTK